MELRELDVELDVELKLVVVKEWCWIAEKQSFVLARDNCDW